jgi:hypothetical protein
MREIAEFRVLEKYAPCLFADHEGKKLDGHVVRKIEIDTSDPRYQKIGQIQRQISEETDDLFFYGWEFHRRYSDDELTAASCFLLTISAAFEPVGQLCGTEYDDSAACPKCGAGARQRTSLRLDLRKAPKSKDIARTIAHEWIVSQRLAERMLDARLTGFELQRVRHKARYVDDPFDLREAPLGRELIRKGERAGAAYPTAEFDIWLHRAENVPLLQQARAEWLHLKQDGVRRTGRPAPVWYQLIVTSPCAEIVPPTRTGINPFNDDEKGEYRCPLGDTIGLALISEVSVSGISHGGSDILCTRQFIARRAGVLRPRRLILISPRFWRLLRAESVKGAFVEVAHLV